MAGCKKFSTKVVINKKLIMNSKITGLRNYRVQIKLAAILIKMAGWLVYTKTVIEHEPLFTAWRYSND